MGKHIGILNRVDLVGPMWFNEIKPVVLEYENTTEKLQELYKHINCDLVEVAYIEIDGKPYVMYFDEEGKIKGPWHPTYPLRYKTDEILDVIAGSVLVVKEDENENILDLTEEEKAAISKHLYDEMMAARKKVDEIIAERRAKHG